MPNSLKPLFTGLDLSQLAPQNNSQSEPEPKREWWSDAVDVALEAADKIPGVDRRPDWNDTGAIGGFTHYIGGSGVPQKVDVSKIDFSNVDPTVFNGIKDILDNKGPGTYDVPPSRAGFAPSFLDNLYLGRLSGELTDATITINNDGSYSWNGKLKISDELYDFDLDNPGRSLPAQLTTAVGHYMPMLIPDAQPKPYTTQFIGTAEFSGSRPNPDAERADAIRARLTSELNGN